MKKNTKLELFCGVQGVGKTTYCQNKKCLMIEHTQLSGNNVQNLIKTIRLSTVVAIKSPLLFYKTIFFIASKSPKKGSALGSMVCKLYDLHTKIKSGKHYCLDENVVQGFFVIFFQINPIDFDRSYRLLSALIDSLQINYSIEITFIKSDPSKIYEQVKSRQYIVDKDLLKNYPSPLKEIERRQKLVNRYLKELSKEKHNLKINMKG